jgi:hypothetical protein
VARTSASPFDDFASILSIRPERPGGPVSIHLQCPKSRSIHAGIESLRALPEASKQARIRGVVFKPQCTRYRRFLFSSSVFAESGLPLSSVCGRDVLEAESRCEAAKLSMTAFIVRSFVTRLDPRAPATFGCMVPRARLYCEEKTINRPVDTVCDWGRSQCILRSKHLAQGFHGKVGPKLYDGDRRNWS